MGGNSGSDVEERDEREKEREYRKFLHFGPTVQADFTGGSTLAVTPLPLRPSSKYIQSVLAGEWGTLPYLTGARPRLQTDRPTCLRNQSIMPN